MHPVLFDTLMIGYACLLAGLIVGCFLGSALSRRPAAPPRPRSAFEAAVLRATRPTDEGCGRVARSVTPPRGGSGTAPPQNPRS